MEIVSFIPYGLSSEESGFVTLLSSYLRSRDVSPWVLRCNGVFSLCERDADTSWRRTVESCARCMVEQKKLSTWAELEHRDLSFHLKPEHISESRRCVQFLQTNELIDAVYQGESLFELCKDSIRNRFGVERPDFSNKQVEAVVRRLYLAAIRMLCASDDLFSTHPISLVLIANGHEFLSKTFLTRAKAAGIEAAVCTWDLNSRIVRLRHPRHASDLSCPLIFEDITVMRSDYRTWPQEIISLLEDVLSFLDLGTGQMKLPITKAVKSVHNIG